MRCLTLFPGEARSFLIVILSRGISIFFFGVGGMARVGLETMLCMSRSTRNSLRLATLRCAKVGWSFVVTWWTATVAGD